MPIPEEENVEITWGDVVRIVHNAPPEFRPGEFGSVCGLWNKPDQQIMYTVEFGDGSTVEIPQSLLEKIESDSDSLPSDN